MGHSHFMNDVHETSVQFPSISLHTVHNWDGHRSGKPSLGFVSPKPKNVPKSTGFRTLLDNIWALTSLRSDANMSGIFPGYAGASGQHLTPSRSGANMWGSIQPNFTPKEFEDCSGGGMVCKPWLTNPNQPDPDFYSDLCPSLAQN